MTGDLAVLLFFVGVTIGIWLRVILVRLTRADVLDHVAPPPPVTVAPLRCICAARLSWCACAIDGVRNPRGAGRGRCCPHCGLPADHDHKRAGV